MDAEAPGDRLGVGDAGTAFPATDRLRPHLATLVGAAGVRALLSRALSLAKPEVAWLSAVQVNAEGDLEGLAPLRPQIEPTEFLNGRAILLAHLLGLLVAFIGPSLTSRLVGDIWPQVPRKHRNFGKEPKREKAK